MRTTNKYENCKIQHGVYYKNLKIPQGISTFEMKIEAKKFP